MNKNRTLLREERGDTLMFALVALALCAVLVTPLLTKTQSGYKVTEQVNLHTQDQLAADAGIEMALWKLQYDPGFQQTLISTHDDDVSGNEIQRITMPEVNGTVPEVDMLCVNTEYTMTNSIGSTDQYLRWVLWGDSETEKHTVNADGSGHRVYGDVRANYEFKVAGSGHAFYGDIEWVTLKTAGNGHTFVPELSDEPTPPREFPLVWELDDFSPSGQYAQAAGAEGEFHHHIGDWSWPDSGTQIPEGLHYVTGDVSISGSGVWATNVTIVAEGAIHVSGAGIMMTPYIGGLSLFSNKTSNHWVLKISGSGNTGGACYAPNGTIELAGSGGTIIGAFLANKIDITGSGARIGLAAVPIGSYEQRLVEAKYDIRSTMGDTTITARVVQDFGERSTWRVYNHNPRPVGFVWEIPGTDSSGSGVAYAGQVQFTTPLLKSGQQVRLTWVDAGGTEQIAVADHSTHDMTPPGAVNQLTVTAQCSEDPWAFRVWKVNNANDFCVALHWDIVGTLQSDSVVAPPGDTYFTTLPVAGTNVLHAYRLDSDGETMIDEVNVSSSSSACGSEQVIPLGLLYLGGSAGDTPTYHVKSWYVE